MRRLRSIELNKQWKHIYIFPFLFFLTSCAAQPPTNPRRDPNIALNEIACQKKSLKGDSCWVKQNDPIISGNSRHIYCPQVSEPHSMQPSYSNESMYLATNQSDFSSEAERLYQSGLDHSVYRQSEKSLHDYNEALKLLSSEENNSKLAAKIYFQIGWVQDQLHNYTQAHEAYQHALELFVKLRYKKEEGNSHNALGIIDQALGRFDPAIEHFKRAIDIRLNNRDQMGEIKARINLASVMAEQGQYQNALDENGYVGKLLDSIKPTTIEVKEEKRGVFTNLGSIYTVLGQWEKSLSFHKKALILTEEMHSKEDKAIVFQSLGYTFAEMHKYPEAINYFNKALEIQKNSNLSSCAEILNSLGLTLNESGKPDKAISMLTEAKQIFNNIGALRLEAATLDSLGSLYKRLNQFELSQKMYEQALAIFWEIKDRPNERIALSNLADLFQKSDKPKLAKILFKQAIDLTESLRRELRFLPSDQQKDYANMAADPYRGLADILIREGRILEAMYVLDLLKVEEMNQYTRTRNVSDQTSKPSYSLLEEQVHQKYGDLIRFERHWEECKRKPNTINCSQSDLNIHKALQDEFNKSIKTLKSESTQDDKQMDPDNFKSVVIKIAEQQPNTIVVYFFFNNEGKLSLLWGDGSAFQVKQLDIQFKQLSDEVLKFYGLLKSDNSEITKVKASGKQLYQWLIEPIQNMLSTNNIQNLVFSLDRLLRYIPMAALFDGEQYLAERYTVSMILTAADTDTEKQPPYDQKTEVLAMGTSKAIEPFLALTNVPKELDEIVKQKKRTGGVFQGLKFLDEDFNYNALQQNLIKQRILHLATHAKFDPRNPDQTYLLLGDGDKLNKDQIKNLPTVPLVVLSACETALGGPDQEGKEVAALGSYFFNNATKTVIATLWSVDDESTSLLMKSFYKNLSHSSSRNAQVTTAPSLREAQINFIQGKIRKASERNKTRATYIPSEDKSNASENPITNDYSHPYYWAPFILIGNRW